MRGVEACFTIRWSIYIIYPYSRPKKNFIWLPVSTYGNKKKKTKTNPTLSIPGTGYLYQKSTANVTINEETLATLVSKTSYRSRMLILRCYCFRQNRSSEQRWGLLGHFFSLHVFFLLPYFSDRYYLNTGKSISNSHTP